MSSAVSGVSPDFLSAGGELAGLIRRKDWSRTPLGPIESWPQSLRTTVSLCLASNFPINIIWGPEHTQIYNDGYRDCCGDAHPRALGEDYSITWASAWPAIGESFERALAGETMYLQDRRMFLKRLNSALEETFFTFSHSPIRDESGGIGGLFHPVTETTAIMLSERRTRALRDLSASLGAATDEAEVARRTVAVLSRFEFDLPFVLYYAPDPDAACYRLAGYHGVAPGRPATPLSVEFKTAAPWPFAEALAGLRTVELDKIPSALQGEPCGPYEEPPNRAFVMPIHVPGVERPPAVLVTAASSRLPMTDDYRSYYELLSITISGAIATVRAREDERKRAEALAKIDRAKTLFFSNVSHEFRTPLTLMLGPLEDALAGSGLPAAERERLDMAHRNSLRLLKLVNSLLDFSRIEAGRVQANYEPLDLAALTADLASSFRSACERAGLKLVVDCPPLPGPVYVDRDMWEKVVLNLLSNAFKFTFEGEIAVRLAAVDGNAELSVRDTGVGIPERELPHLFERFHRIEGQRSRTYEGSGIGLALVQELVKLHGGAIYVESKAAQGAKIAVRIPFGTAHLAQDRIGAERSLASTSVRARAYVEEALRWLPDEPASDGAVAGEIEAPGAMPLMRESARILLADDNADMRAYVRRLLGGSCDVQTVADGEAAIEAMRGRRPDLVLADIMMPRLDGFGLLRAIRAAPEWRDIPVIMLSARAGEESRVEGLEAGANDYLVKPFPARELIARVSANLEMSRIRREAIAAVAESEKRFRGTFENAAVGIAHVSLDGYWLRVNRRLCDILGYSREELLALTFGDITHPEDLEADWAGARAVAAGEIPTYSMEKRYLHKNGNIVWVNLTVSLLRDDTGRPLHFISVIEDISARKRAELALKKSEARFRQLADSMPHIVWTARPDGYVDYYNERWYDFTGFDRPRRTDREWEHILHSEDVERCREAFYNAIRSGEPCQTECRFWDRKRSCWNWFLGRAVPVRDEEGRIAKWYGTFTDIDEQKRTQEDLLHANQDLEQFAYSASHDLQEPLRNVAIYSQLIKKRYSGKLDADAEEFLRYMLEGASRMQHLVSDLLAYTHAGVIDCESTAPVSAEAVLAAVLEGLHPAMEEAGGVVTHDPLPLVSLEEVHLQQLLQNLIANGLKYRRDDESPRVHVAASRDNGLWRFSVEDNGIGIEPEYHEKVFGIFKRLHAKGGKYAGTGIGLAICQKIVERYGGRIWLESELGTGSVFYFTCPGRVDE